MGHRQKMTDKQRLDWDMMQYRARLEARRGHNYPYWEDNKYANWQIGETTKSELVAKELLAETKRKYHSAKIICGYVQTIQRVKHYTIIYKP
jgi:myosin-crossreactive antigen